MRPGSNEDAPVGWMVFGTAGEIRLEDLQPEDVRLEDISRGLSRIQRYAGQTREAVSVAWHSIAVARLCRPAGHAAELAGLFHDAGETFVGDWLGTLVTLAGPELQALRKHTQDCCYAAAGVDTTDAGTLKTVKTADRLMLRYEMTAAWGYGRAAIWQTDLGAEERASIMELLGQDLENAIGNPDKTNKLWMQTMRKLLPPTTVLGRQLRKTEA